MPDEFINIVPGQKREDDGLDGQGHSHRCEECGNDFTCRFANYSTCLGMPMLCGKHDGFELTNLMEETI